MSITAISFDLGQTLLELDPGLLATKARRSGYAITEALVPLQIGLAWDAYNVAIANGKSGQGAWTIFMRALLVGVGLSVVDRQQLATAEELDQFVRQLWSEQPEENLWQKPIPGMLDLVRHLRQRSVKIAVLTNSEGRAKELLDSTGFGAFIDVVVDSGVEGIDKPDPRIFALMAQRLRCAPEEIIHVGDSYAADVLGAIGAKMTPIWFTRQTEKGAAPGLMTCRNAGELQALLFDANPTWQIGVV